MKDLPIVASATVGTVVVFFLSAWDAKTKGAEAYREAVKAAAWYTMAAIAALTIGVAAKMLSPFSKRIAFYSYRRSYVGAH